MVLALRSQAGAGMDKLYYRRFAIDEEPHCVWGWDLPDRNTEFIEGLDAEVLATVGAKLTADVSEDDAQCNATMLRILYGISLESFFALLCATIQAPDCIFGWLLEYRTQQLLSLVDKISKGRPILSRLPLQSVSWQSISDRVHSCLPIPEEALQEVCSKSQFGAFWCSLAADFLDEKSRAEFNSLKHGLRIQQGGFHLAFGPQEAIDVPCPPERMISLGGSRFGSTFFLKEKLLGGKVHFATRRCSMNWSTEDMLQRIEAMSMFFQNILSFLKIGNGSGSERVKMYFPRKGALDRRLDVNCRTGCFTVDAVVSEAVIKDFDPQEILGVYKDFGDNSFNK